MLTLDVLKKNLNNSQYEEIKVSKGLNDRNLLQSAAYHSKDMKIYKAFWENDKNLCRSSQLQMINDVDVYGRNIIH